MATSVARYDSIAVGPLSQGRKIGVSKTSVRPSKSCKNLYFWHAHPARMSMKNFGLRNCSWRMWAQKFRTIHEYLMALYFAIQIRIRIVRSCERPAKRPKPKLCETKPRAFLPLLLVLTKRVQFQAAIRVAPKHCDSCGYGGPIRDGLSRGEAK